MKAVYWCPSCGVPIIEKDVCPRCGTVCRRISTNGVCNPVFAQERKLLSFILQEDVVNCNIWYLGSSSYLIDGKRTKIPYVDFYKQNKHLEFAEQLRDNIVSDDSIASTEAFVSANAQYITELIYEAEGYVVDLYSRLSSKTDVKYMPTVSFSGGKDSTVVSRIVRDALQNESILHFFGDTTLEFPSTHKYAEDYFRKENPFTPLIPSETSKDFFNLCNVFGPPSKFERWCCTIFKTGNLNKEYQNLDGNSLTFLGIRHSESRERQNYERTQTHSKIGSQINAMPIIDWCDCDVWLYILFKGICFNDAYRWGYKRVGCWCCPNNSDWSTMLTEIYYPDLAEKWRNTLTDFAVKTNKTDVEDYVLNGKWKTRKGASGLETRNVSIVDTPCNLSDRARNLILKKKVTKEFIEFIKPFGEISVLEKEDGAQISVSEKACSDNENVYPKKHIFDLVIVWGKNVIKVLPDKSVDLQLLLNRLKCQIRKYQYCIRCSACDSICPYGAINTLGNTRYFVDDSLCKQNMAACSKCIAKFYNGCITCQVLAGKKKIDDNEDY